MTFFGCLNLSLKQPKVCFMLLQVLISLIRDGYGIQSTWNCHSYCRCLSEQTGSSTLTVKRYKQYQWSMWVMFPTTASNNRKMVATIHEVQVLAMIKTTLALYVLGLHPVFSTTRFESWEVQSVDCLLNVFSAKTSVLVRVFFKKTNPGNYYVIF